MKEQTLGTTLGEAVMQIGHLLGQSTRLGISILGLFGDASARVLCDVAQGRSSLKAFGGCDSCEIPPPCWEPQPLGQVTSYVAPGGKATVRFRVKNCSFNSRKITFEAPKGASDITFSPVELMLGPQEHGTVSASVVMSPDAKQGYEREYLLLVHGCRDYYLRWVVKVMPCGFEMCNEVEIDDCPDMIHYWYDHFYCHRHCQPDSGRDHQ